MKKKQEQLKRKISNNKEYKPDLEKFKNNSPVLMQAVLKVKTKKMSKNQKFPKGYLNNKRVIIIQEIVFLIRNNHNVFQPCKMCNPKIIYHNTKKAVLKNSRSQNLLNQSLEKTISLMIMK